MIVLNVERSILRPRLAKMRKEYSFTMTIKQRICMAEEETEERPKNGRLVQGLCCHYKNPVEFLGHGKS